MQTEELTQYSKNFVDFKRRLMDLTVAAGVLPVAAGASALVIATLIANGELELLSKTKKMGLKGKIFSRLAFKVPAYPKRLRWLLEVLKRAHAHDVPLLLNLVKGDIALVGPEMITPEEGSELQDHEFSRFAVRPGLTDVYKLRKRMNIAFDERSVLERAYLAERSPKHDAMLLLRTLPTLIMGRQAPVNVNSFVLNDIEVANVTLNRAIGKIFDLAESKSTAFISFVNPHCFNVSAVDRQYTEILKSADLVLPDGIGIKVAGMMIGAEVKENVNGTDMFPRLCEKAARENKRIYLLGARPGVAETARRNMQAQIDNLDICGTWHGYFEDYSEEEEQIISAINVLRPDILLVAKGVPQQEKWIQRNLEKLDVGVAIGVGGLFDFYSGRIKRAPVWVRELGMEWGWRLMKEPARMFDRYIIGNPKFLHNVWRWYIGQARTTLIKRFDGINIPRRRVRVELEYQLRRALWWSATRGSAIVKRYLDVIGSGAGLIVLSPLFGITAAAIKLEDPEGPVFFTQNRVGRRSQIFKMYKFRSMVANAENLKEQLLEYNESKAGVTFKIKQDPRVTKVGKFVRRFSIDEMPQLYNVFIGDMSLVGPRPPTPNEVYEYKVFERERLEITPGLTCLWQVSGRSLLDFNQQVILDRKYIQNQSIWGDLSLILRTIPAVLSGYGAY